MLLRRSLALPRPVNCRGLSTTACRAAQKPNSRFDPSGRAPGFARRVPRASPPDSNSSQGQEQPDNARENVAGALQRTAQNDENGLLAPVHIPEDPHAILKETHPATSILHNSSIIVQRQLEMMNVLMGFEQANRYVIHDAHGNQIGFLAEQEHGMGNALARQAFRTHRSFTTHVFDKHEKEILRFHRPFSWISSRIRVYDALNATSEYSSSDALSGVSAGSISNQTSAEISSLPLSEMRVIGEAQQQWAPLRRKYNLFLQRDLSTAAGDASSPQLTSGDLPLSNSTALQAADPSSANLGMAQFAYVDEPFLSWDFTLKSSDERLLGSVNRNFAGFGRELFTDTGVYALRMDSAGLAAEPRHIISQTGAQELLGHATGMTLDQRAVMLATAVSVDFDYFSRQRGGVAGGGFMPLWFPMGGGAAEEAGAAGGAAGTAGTVGAAQDGGAAAAAEETAATAGRAGGPIAGAGSLAGYDAMQRGRETTWGDEQSPQAEDGDQMQDPGFGDAPPPPSDEQQWPWGGGDSGGQGGGGSPGGSGGGGDGGGDGGSWFDAFFDE